MTLTVKIRPIRNPTRPPPRPCDALIAKGSLDEALDLCREALRRNPDDPALMRDLADVLTMTRRYDEALVHYRAAAEKSPADRVLHELLCGAHVARGDEEKGRQVLRTFFRDHPTEAGGEIQNAALENSRKILLRVFGLDGTLCRLEEEPNVRPRPHYRGGHFLTAHLLPPRRHRVIDWTVALDNINRRDDVPRHDLLLNTIADADTERRSLESLSRYLKSHPGVPVVNHPDRVLETTRDANARRLAAVPGLVFPRTVRFRRDGASPESIAARIGAWGLAYPIIVRETGTHTGRTVALVRNDADLAGYFAQATGEEFYLIQFMDERFTGEDGTRYFNKKRFFCIDGRLYPVVSHVDRIWNVHGYNRLSVMKQTPWMQEQERRYLDDPIGAIGEKTYRALESLGGLVGLDFFGIDYTVRGDGTLLVFELNASMRHSHDHARHFPYMRPAMERISQAFAAMIEKKLRPPRRTRRRRGKGKVRTTSR